MFMQEIAIRNINFLFITISITQLGIPITEHPHECGSLFSSSSDAQRECFQVLT